MPAEIDVSESPLRRPPIAHRWWARRGWRASRAAVLLAHAPELAADPELLEALLAGQRAAIASRLDGVDLLDLCSGAATVSSEAAACGASVTAVDIHPIAVLIGRAELQYPRLLAEADPAARGCLEGHWAGLSDELEHWWPISPIDVAVFGWRTSPGSSARGLSNARAADRPAPLLGRQVEASLWSADESAVSRAAPARDNAMQRSLGMQCSRPCPVSARFRPRCLRPCKAPSIHPRTSACWMSPGCSRGPVSFRTAVR